MPVRMLNCKKLRSYRISSLVGAGGLLSDNGGGTLEEREARAMASTTALRRDLAPIVRVRVVQATAGNMEQVIRQYSVRSCSENKKFQRLFNRKTSLIQYSKTCFLLYCKQE